MNKIEAAKCLRGTLTEIHPAQGCRIVTVAAADAGAAALEREAEREEKEPPSCASVSIAGGLVHGEWEQVKAVQSLILENEKLRREKAEGVEKAQPKPVTLEEMERELRLPYSVTDRDRLPTDYVSKDRKVVCLAAADTLRRLREEGGMLLTERYEHGIRPELASKLLMFLRSLGVESK